MAKSAYEIRMDYNNAVRQAESLEEIASDMRKTAQNDIEECISDISGCWKGDNATAYTKKCSQLKENIEQSARKLENTAKTIRKIAKNTYNAEMEALRLARLRTY